MRSLEQKQQKKRRRRRFFRFMLLVLFLGLLSIASLLAIRYIGFFPQSEIRVEGNESIASEKVREVAYIALGEDWWRPLLGISNQFAWPGKVSEEVLFFEPSMKSLSIEKHYLDRYIVLRVEERERVGTWCFHENDPTYCGWFSEDGVLYRAAFRSQGSLLTTIDDYSRPRVSLGKKVMESGQVRRILQSIEELSATDFSVKEIRVEDRALKEVVVATFDGPDIYVSLQSPPNNLAQALQQVRSRENVSQLQYIDLRVEGRVYYQ